MPTFRRTTVELVVQNICLDRPCDGKRRRLNIKSRPTHANDPNYVEGSPELEACPPVSSNLSVCASPVVVPESSCLSTLVVPTPTAPVQNSSVECGRLGVTQLVSNDRMQFDPPNVCTSTSSYNLPSSRPTASPSQPKSDWSANGSPTPSQSQSQPYNFVCTNYQHILVRHGVVTFCVRCGAYVTKGCAARRLRETCPGPPTGSTAGERKRQYVRTALLAGKHPINGKPLQGEPCRLSWI